MVLAGLEERTSLPLRPVERVQAIQRDAGWSKGHEKPGSESSGSVRPKNMKNGYTDMLQTISIHNGQLSIGKLLFQLYDESGKPNKTEYYRGDAFLQGNQLRLVVGRSTVYEFSVAAHPTPESVEYQNGYEKGKAQKRRRLPKDYTDHWYSGWLAAWNEKS